MAPTNGTDKRHQKTALKNGTGNVRGWVEQGVVGAVA